MSKESTNPDQQVAAEQFDAEAAQKAKDFLEQGTVRREPDPDTGEKGALLSQDVDDNGVRWDTSLTIRHLAHNQKLDYEKEVKTRDTAKANSDKYGENATALERVTDNIVDDPELRSAISKKSDEYKYRHSEERNRSFEAEANRKGALWDANKAYKDNEAGYVAAAVEDANAAGHDITLGEHHFPAQRPEQPQPGAEQPSQDAA